VPETESVAREITGVGRSAVGFVEEEGNVKGSNGCATAAAAATTSVSSVVVVLCAWG
jgi:hypothetical protein